MNKLVIKCLKITRFRNLQNIELNFLDTYNEICGDNGLGKTAILDAIRYLLFNANDRFKKSDNYKTITENITNKSSDGNKPSLAGEFLLNDKKLILEIDNNDFYINHNQLKNSAAYLSAIANELGLQSVNELNEYINYLELETILGSAKDAKTKITDTLILIVNRDLQNENQINPSFLDETLAKIEDLGNQIKEMQRDYKMTAKSIEAYKTSNPEVKDWDHIISDNDNEYIALKNRISKYDNIAHELESIVSKINRIELELQRCREQYQSTSAESEHKTKVRDTFWNKFITFVLSILSLGIYYIIKSRKKAKNSPTSATNNYRTLNENIDHLEKEKSIHQKNRDDLLHSIDYANVNIDNLKAQEFELRQSKNNYEDLNHKKFKYNEFNKDLEKLNLDITSLISKQNALKNKRLEIIYAINETLNKSLKNFNISLIDENENATVIIKYKNIEFKHLNHAAKVKIVYELSNFLKRNINLQIFDLIDQIESVNNFNASNNQVIACRVTTDKELKLNGKNLY